MGNQNFKEKFINYEGVEQRKNGVYYTDKRIVDHMIQSIDWITKNQFNKKTGLCDNQVHVMDPATGTGSYIFQTIKHIYNNFDGDQNQWNDYVENQLLKKIEFYEILDKSYNAAIENIESVLKDTGYQGDVVNNLKSNKKSFLEKPDGSESINGIKIIIGNPPYNFSSQNKNDWINGLLDDYRKEPGGKERLKERSVSFNDDYCKFIRYSTHLIEKNGEGVLAFINPHGIIDNVTFRGMRWHLLNTFDKIYVIDLHGNRRKQERCPDGSIDENVWPPVQQGICINIFVKTGKKKDGELAKVFHSEVYGRRKVKFDFISNNKFENINFQEAIYSDPYYFFKPVDESNREEYESGFKLKDLFILSNGGTMTAFDNGNFSFSREEHERKMADIVQMPENQWREKYEKKEDGGKWRYQWAREDVIENNINSNYMECVYRPFDIRYTLYTGNGKGISSRPGYSIMQHMIDLDNIGLIASRGCGVNGFRHVFVSDKIIDLHSIPGGSSLFPLYRIEERENQKIKVSNLNQDIVDEISYKLNTRVKDEDIFAYIYAILHHQKYRDDFSEFLKTDFPRIPYPTNIENYKKFVELGNRLIQLHLDKTKSSLDNYSTTFPETGNNVIEKISYKNERIYINKTQYFGNVSNELWDFKIGGHRVLKKWINYRKNRELSFDDINFFKKIVKILLNTIDIMNEIENINY